MGQLADAWKHFKNAKKNARASGAKGEGNLKAAFDAILPPYLQDPPQWDDDDQAAADEIDKY